MRKFFLFSAIICFALSTAQAQNLNQILNDHFKTSGQELMSKVSTMVTVGKLSYVTAGMESAVTIYRARPNKLRVEASILGSKVIQTYNGTTGWIYAPAMGIIAPQELGAEELKAVLQQTYFESLLWNYKEKGSSLQLAGSSDDGSAHMVKMTQKDGEVLIVFIDKKSHLITGSVTKQMMGSAEVELVTTMKDYKTVKGIQTPHYTSTKMDGELMMTMAIESIEYDKKIDAAMFEKPVVQ